VTNYKKKKKKKKGRPSVRQSNIRPVNQQFLASFEDISVMALSRTSCDPTPQ